MRLLNTKKIPLTSVGSFLAIIISFVSILASSLLYNGSFSMLYNWISDLGNPSKNPAGYIYFNVGCILTGVAITLSIAGLEKWKTADRSQKNLVSLSRYCGFIMAFALIMVGVFSENYSKMHYIWASVYFISMLLFLIIINFALRNHPNYLKRIWYYTFLSLSIIFIFIFTIITGLHIPILEWSAVIGGLIWIGLIGYNTIKLEKQTI